jgi:hypothetical protein
MTFIPHITITPYTGLLECHPDFSWYNVIYTTTHNIISLKCHNLICGRVLKAFPYFSLNTNGPYSEEVPGAGGGNVVVVENTRAFLPVELPMAQYEM